MYCSIVLLNESKITGLCSVYVEYSHQRKRKRFNTGIKVSEKFWNQEKGIIKKDGTENVKEDNQTIKGVKTKIESVISRFVQENAGNQPTIQQLEIELQKHVKKEDKDIFTYLDEYIELKKGSTTPNTRKGYNSLKLNLQEYKKENKKEIITFETINNVFLDKFKNFLISKNYHDTTIYKRFRILKAFLNYYLIADIHNNKKFRDYKISSSKGNREQVITLTYEELLKIKDLKFQFNKRLDYIRDLFLIQSFTGLRYSDVIRLSKSNIKTEIKEKKEYKYIITDIEKTDDSHHTVPLFGIVEEILKKYDYKLKKISNVKYNKYIKEVCENVKELKNPETVIHYSGGQKKTDTIERYKLITTHTARRNFVTVLLEKDVNPKTIMKWTGHKNLSEFIKYANIRQGETAEIDKLNL